MNPYLTDRDMLERILAAARRGVDVQLVVSERRTTPRRAQPCRHRYGDLIDAGVEIWGSPARSSTQVVVADDVVSFGTVNLGSWALCKDSEVAMVVRSPDAASAVRGAAVRAGHRTLDARRAALRHEVSAPRAGSGTS